MNDAEISRQTTDIGDESPLPAGLYLVATPIGNMGDITSRAIDTLKRVHVIACEDTRTTGGLLKRLGIQARLTPYHDHNADAARPGLLKRIADGQAVALVSDAGMPLISDPGYKLVRACRQSGLAVTCAPGASSVLAALALSGLPTDRFFFAGFAPAKQGKLATFCSELASVPGTLVVLEGVSKLPRTIRALADALGHREAAVCREMTKLHEEVRSGLLSDLATHYAEAGAPKGEVVIVIGPAEDTAPPDDADIEARLIARLNAGDSIRDAAGYVAQETGIARKTLYTMGLSLTRTIPEANTDDEDATS